MLSGIRVVDFKNFLDIIYKMVKDFYVKHEFQKSLDDVLFQHYNAESSLEYVLRDRAPGIVLTDLQALLDIYNIWYEVESGPQPNYLILYKGTGLDKIPSQELIEFIDIFTKKIEAVGADIIANRNLKQSLLEKYNPVLNTIIHAAQATEYASKPSFFTVIQVFVLYTHDLLAAKKLNLYLKEFPQLVVNSFKHTSGRGVTLGVPINHTQEALLNEFFEGLVKIKEHLALGNTVAEKIAVILFKYYLPNLAQIPTDSLPVSFLKNLSDIATRLIADDLDNKEAVPLVTNIYSLFTQAADFKPQQSYLGWAASAVKSILWTPVKLPTVVESFNADTDLKNLLDKLQATNTHTTRDVSHLQNAQLPRAQMA